MWSRSALYVLVMFTALSMVPCRSASAVTQQISGEEAAAPAVRPAGQAEAAHNDKQAADVEVFPPGTDFVARDAVSGKTYYATDKELGQLGAGSPPLVRKMEGVDSIAFSPDGKYIIAGLCILSTSDLHLVRCFGIWDVWWEGSGIGYLAGQERLYTGGKVFKGSVGKTVLVSTDVTGRYVLGVRQISPGNATNGDTPTNQVELWRLEKGRRPKFVRVLYRDLFDPINSGYPFRLAVANERSVAFGYPTGGGVGVDLVGALSGDSVKGKLRDSKNRELMYLAAPVVFGKTVVGLAEAVVDLMMPSGDKYIYEISDSHVRVVSVPKNTVLVTYDPIRQALGIGTEEKDGTHVRYSKQLP